jgi:hypothetical protein
VDMKKQALRVRDPAGLFFTAYHLLGYICQHIFIMMAVMLGSAIPCISK